MVCRPEFDRAVIAEILSDLDLKIQCRLREKGPGAYICRHETLGVITEEYHELLDAVHSGALGWIRAELIDLAVAATLGMASLSQGAWVEDPT